jgi:hypothetical protein
MYAIGEVKFLLLYLGRSKGLHEEMLNDCS